MVTACIYAICCLLCLVNGIAGVTSSTQPTETGSQNVYYTLPLELVERLMLKESVPDNTAERLLSLIVNQHSGGCRDSQNSDVYTRLMVLLLEKLNKEQTRLGKEVASLTESLKNENANSSRGSFERTEESAPTFSEAALSSLLQRLENISSGLMAQTEHFESPTQPRDSFGKNCRLSSDRPKNCYELYQQGKNESGVYTIYPHKCHRSEEGVRVWCDLEDNGGGWTVVLSRRPLDDQVNFNRGWIDYKTGFGEAETEYWIGNEALHSITSSGRHRLRVEMEDWDGGKAFAEYSSFLVDGEDLNYRLHVGGASGTGGDAFSYHDNMAFTTTDRDNDRHSKEHSILFLDNNCAASYLGGFWYDSCHKVSPTALLLKKQKSTKGITWASWYSDRTTLKEIYFKVKEYPCV